MLTYVFGDSALPPGLPRRTTNLSAGIRKVMPACLTLLALTTTGVAGTIVGGSTLLSAADLTQLETWLGEGSLTVTKVFSRVAGDGKNSANFHTAADGKGRTFTVIEALPAAPYGRKVIGGYNPQSWSQISNYNYTTADVARTAFLFNLTSATLHRQKLGGVSFDAGYYQTYNHGIYGPTFGGGHDIYVPQALNELNTYQFSYGPAGQGGPSILGAGQGFAPVGTMEVFTISVGANAAPVATGGTYSVPETAAVGSAVGTVTATDEDADQTRTWAITAGNEAARFAIDSATGAITVAGALDYETAASFTLTVTATDNGTPPASGSATVTVNVAFVGPNPPGAVLFGKGGAVPNAGVIGSGIAAGAVFTAFGIPAVNEAGAVAFVGKWTAPASGETAAQYGTGIFAGNPAVLVVKKGDPAGPGVTFSNFKDPVINAAGKIAFPGTIIGTGITLSTNTILATNAFTDGACTIVAQKGNVADAADGARFLSFPNLSLQGAEVLFTASLQGAGITTANNFAAYCATASGTVKVAREAQPFAGTTVKSFKLLASVSGSPGQNRAHSEGNAAFLVQLSNGTQALVDGAGGTLTSFAVTGQLTGGTELPEATFKSFGPVAAPDSTYAAMLATLNTNVGGVTIANAKGVFLGTGVAFEPVAQLSGATGMSSAVFKAFKDPVLAPGTGEIAFGATITGAGAVTTANDATLWWKPAGGALTLLAQEGAEPVGTASGVKWKAFTSLAISGGSAGGPLFTATLLQGSGGVNAGNDAGLWAVDSTGTSRLLVREGDVIGGKTLRNFAVLTAVSGSPGVSRSFNGSGLVAYRASFTDGATAIVTVQVP